MLRARLMLILLVCGLIANGQDDMIWKISHRNYACLNFLHEPPIYTYLNTDTVKFDTDELSTTSVYSHYSRNICLFTGHKQEYTVLPPIIQFRRGDFDYFYSDTRAFNISLEEPRIPRQSYGIWLSDTSFVLFLAHYIYSKSAFNDKLESYHFNLRNDRPILAQIDSTWSKKINLNQFILFYKCPYKETLYILSLDSSTKDKKTIAIHSVNQDSNNQIKIRKFFSFSQDTVFKDTIYPSVGSFLISEDESTIVILPRHDYGINGNYRTKIFQKSSNNQWELKEFQFDLNVPSLNWYSMNSFLTNKNIFYVIVSDQRPKNNVKIDQRIILIKFDLNSTDIWKTRYEFKAEQILHTNTDTVPFLKGIKLGPNGKLLTNNARNLFEIKEFEKKGDSSKLNVIPVVDSFGNPYTQYILSSKFSTFYFPNTLGIYRKAKFESFPTCKGLEMAFYNTSDTQHWTHYKLYFGDGDTVALSKDDFPLQKDLSQNLLKVITHYYPKPGRYFVKLQAFNKMGFVWYSDSITIHPPPVAGFTVSDTAGCQWIAHHFKNTSSFSPRFSGPPPAAYAYHWQFGNGLDTSMSFASTPTAAQGSVSHTYTQNGLYRVSLVANDGFCADTFTLNQQVNILPAPRPGISLAPSDSGCSPMQVQVSRLWSDPIDSAFWQFGDGNVRSVLVNPATAVHTYDHTLSTQQKYLLKQRLFGSTGCITEDSLLISVLPGFENGYTPILDFASVNPDQSVFVSWQPHAHAAQYQLYKNNAPLAFSVNANFTDPDYTAQAVYQASAINACAQPSPPSNIGKLMLLQGQNQNNQSALLQWTAYEDWSAVSGILHYHLEVNQNGQFVPVAQTNNRDFTDAEFIQSGQYERCYRVTAVQTAKPNIQSYSNTACVGYDAVIFVPNAFSPNDDGLNDVFEPFNIGFKHYTLKVYNRWGEKIAEGRSWDGKIQGVPAPVGLYHFQIEGQTGKSENTFLKGEVMLTK